MRRRWTVRSTRDVSNKRMSVQGAGDRSSMPIATVDAVPRQRDETGDRGSDERRAVCSGSCCDYSLAVGRRTPRASLPTRRRPSAQIRDWTPWIPDYKIRKPSPARNGSPTDRRALVLLCTPPPTRRPTCLAPATSLSRSPVCAGRRASQSLGG